MRIAPWLSPRVCNALAFAGGFGVWFALGAAGMPASLRSELCLAASLVGWFGLGLLAMRRSTMRTFALTLAGVLGISFALLNAELPASVQWALGSVALVVLGCTVWIIVRPRQKAPT